MIELNKVYLVKIKGQKQPKTLILKDVSCLKNSDEIYSFNFLEYSLPLMTETENFIGELFPEQIESISLLF